MIYLFFESSFHFSSLQFGFRKWKGHVTERPIEDQSDIIKELYSDLSIIKAKDGDFSLVCFNDHLDIRK